MLLSNSKESPAFRRGESQQLDHDGKLLGWAQTGLGMGQTGCIIHSLRAESDSVLYRGSCSEWDIEKITIKSGS